MRKNVYNFIKSHNLLNRVFDMIYYYKVIKDLKYKENTKKWLFQKLKDIDYVESLAKYFELKLSKEKNIEVCCNLKDLINDLNFLKQYL